ncbi:Undecaprenyl-phosphate 4-deoxy-4-formamido-L-arabinose transferase [Achromobacter deleyi]|uniref:Undecaprenyl-phosphate 4-deoxy-4-formamido-L-arabinose transferase n=1 Tax=Achromobacter deleyi TaxID=1353891 RepID=A0A6S7A368_9BURK|nr:glycosyltransferase [Achromobacter deleyi]CAB3673352.1 Undecaprenyl-phosphate 4-deoxy-4-formamido-L-arabinose transferase [Achromobacter deleyi]CAB3835908.1 Undecaprenyl-phosphate 4-deoxy-4-formamido-L-arabinose transferase [Achromobacter deleyi]CAB3844044.1 Undecaprenyl-phosphate 4-deoxy-4-formamido-L-arabinose transferase [Achromobacter deleyi]CAB3889164.1 Undecaprenyl-phosphate 4-deoxy-4-formamido-L-arabinose transferase [Achromobacter deleyi]
MAFYPVFLSVVFVVRNQEAQLEGILRRAHTSISSYVSDYELIIVDNASNDGSVHSLKGLTSLEGLPNLQVYALTKEVSSDTAAWVGLENALGDFVAVIDPLVDEIDFLPQMLEKAVTGADVVFANNELKPRQSLAYRAAFGIFNMVYQRFNGVHLDKEAPSYRILNKRIINFILQHPQPSVTYKHLPATGGFARAYMTYSARPLAKSPKKLGESIDRGMRLLVSTTQAPMRLVTTLSLFGAAANFFYSIYVVAVGLFKTNVAPGWVSLSLQQSGMFFLISLVLLVLGEYILHMTSLSNEGPLYHVGQEFTSARLTRKEKLNIETVAPHPESTDDRYERVSA